MEATAVMSEEAWSSLSCMYTSKDELEFLTQFPSGFASDLSEIWSSDKEPSSLVCSSEFCNSNDCLVSQENSILSPDDGQSVFYLDPSYSHSDDVSQRYQSHHFAPRSVAFCDHEMGRFASVLYFPPAGESLLKSNNLVGFLDKYDISDIGKLEKQELDVDQPQQRDLPNAIANVKARESKKRSRNMTDVTKSKRNLKSDKYQKVVSESTTKSNAVITKKSSDSHSSEEHSSITHHEVTKEETHNIKSSQISGGKVKSGKDASNDPQSLYARKRRERINERLRILQCLVPNGTKVDISTMLEEAVHYVKFLQLQIKLLSSDDTWMYAPLAYNGMDIGISNFDSSTSPR